MGKVFGQVNKKKRYGTQQFTLALIECLTLGIKEILITCDYDNIASAKIIKANGGIQTGETTTPRTREKVIQNRISI